MPKTKFTIWKKLQNAVSDPTSSGTTLDFISNITQNAQGVITALKKKVKIANNLTTTAEGSVLDARQGKALNDGKIDKTSIKNNLTTADTGYVLDASQGKALNDGKVNKSGDTMTGDLGLKGASIYSYNTSGNFKGAIQCADNSNASRFQFVEYLPSDSTKYENYRLPALTTTLTQAASYDILTTKSNAVYNALDSTSTTRPLSAAQGKALNDSTVKLTGTQTIAGSKTFTNVPRMKNGTSPSILFQGTNLTSDGARLYAYGLETSEGKYGQPRFRFLEYSPSSDGETRTDYYEEYFLPTVNAGRTANATYNILTTKSNAVVNSLTSTSTTNVLSAAQGKALNEGKMGYFEVSNPNFNELIGSGQYGIQGGSPTNYPANATNKYGTLLVLEYRRSSNNYYTQVFYNHADEIFYRHSNANAASWNAWLQVACADKIKELGKVSTLDIASRTAGYTYYFIFDSDSTNTPAGNGSGHGYFYTNPDSSNYGRMVLYSNNGIYTRKLSAGTWTEWQELTTSTDYSSNLTAGQSGTSLTDAYLKKDGNVITLSCMLKNNSTSASKTISAYSPLVKFPSSIGKPSQHIWICARGNTNNVVYDFYVSKYNVDGDSTKGQVLYADTLTLPASGWVKFSATWIV